MARLAELHAAGVGPEVDAAAAEALQPQQRRRVVRGRKVLRERVCDVLHDRRVERARRVDGLGFARTRNSPFRPQRMLSP
jgi:hypothetical protein